ncbi:MAG: tetratricopeptide repeat protein [Magnetococcales bacterium]|nr:tetratricopeptide repeat protein [Magnetococcales bacterium]
MGKRIGIGLLWVCWIGWVGSAVAAAVDPLESGRALLRVREYGRAAEAFAVVLQGRDGGGESRLGAWEGQCEAMTRQALADSGGGLATRAVGVCSEGIRQGAGSAILWRWRGLARLVAGQADQALINLNHALRLTPEDARLLRDRGVVLLGLGRMAEAEGDFQRAIRLDPDQAWHFFNQGMVLARTGKVTEAAAAWRGFVRLRGEGGREWLAGMVRRDPELRRAFEAVESAREEGNVAVARVESSAPAASDPVVPVVAVPAAVEKKPAPAVAAPAAVEKKPEPAVAAPAVEKKPDAVAAPAVAEKKPAPAVAAPAVEKKPDAVAAPAAVEKKPAPAVAAPAVEKKPAPVVAAPAVEKKPAPVVPAAQPAAAVSAKGGETGFEFRLGSFQDRGNLDATRRALDGLGWTVREEQVTVGERHFLRLVAGPFATEAEARTALERAAKLPGVHPEAVRAATPNH